MKKFLFVFIMFFCSACTTKYYSYHMWNSFESSKERDLKNKTIKFVGNDVAIGNKFIESLSVYLNMEERSMYRCHKNLINKALDRAMTDYLLSCGWR